MYLIFSIVLLDISHVRRLFIQPITISSHPYTGGKQRTYKKKKGKVFHLFSVLYNIPFYHPHHAEQPSYRLEGYLKFRETELSLHRTRIERNMIVAHTTKS